MKKVRLLSSFVLSILLVSLFTVTAFAGTFSPAPAYNDVQSSPASATSKAAPIPVYGYIGEDEDLVDPDPEDPDTPPTVYQVNVSVPVKILWAAFESDGGAITSPTYHVKNNSSTKDLDIELTSFAATGVDNATVDKYVDLAFTPVGTGFTASPALITSGGSATYLTTPTDLSTAELTAGSQWNFNFTGTYTDTPLGWDTVYQPSYSLVFTFSID
ncbi:MAG: hypothetical protein LBL36_02730 [Clostridiales Family XIII bacterium]|jgi:hypothetical protein|nr:hypothetical protein [Clostridiales Family XIII bacterium]